MAVFNKKASRYCPKCGSDDFADILYGDIDQKEYISELKVKGVFIGGLIVREHGPHFLCNQCGTAWCKDSDDLYILDEFGEFIETGES